MGCRSSLAVFSTSGYLLKLALVSYVYHLELSIQMLWVSVPFPFFYLEEDHNQIDLFVQILVCILFFVLLHILTMKSMYWYRFMLCMFCFFVWGIYICQKSSYECDQKGEETTIDQASRSGLPLFVFSFCQILFLSFEGISKIVYSVQITDSPSFIPWFALDQAPLPAYLIFLSFAKCCPYLLNGHFISKFFH